MKHHNVRNRLIDNTIMVIAANGLEKTTTKAIVKGNVMLDFAVKVHNGQMPGKEDYAEHVFRVIYRSIEQYFKKREVKTND